VRPIHLHPSNGPRAGAPAEAYGTAGAFVFLQVFISNSQFRAVSCGG